MQTCSICQHADRPQIEAAWAAGGSLRAVAQHFSVSYDALHRHGRHGRQGQQQTQQVESMRRVLAQIHTGLNRPRHDVMSLVAVLRTMAALFEQLIDA